MKRMVKLTVVLLVLAALGLFICLVPLPVSRIREPALIEFHPDALVDVSIPALDTLERLPVLEKLDVRDGEYVSEQHILAVFTHQELNNKLIGAEAEFLLRCKKLEALREELTRTKDERDKEEIKTRIQYVEAEKLKYEAQLNNYLDMQERLTIKAPRAGIVVNPPRMDDVGKEWDRDRPTFCRIGDPRRIRARLAITPDERQLLAEEWTDGNKSDAGPDRYDYPSSLPVTIRVHGREGQTWSGRLTHLPWSTGSDKIPIQLTTRGGGPIAVTPVPHQTDTYIPQGQQFFVFVDFVDPDDAICPGTMAQVKVHCKPRSLGWWMWRTALKAFDLALVGP